MFPIEPVLPENNPYKMMVYQHVPYYLVILVDDPFSDTPKSSQIHHYLVNVESSFLVAKSPFFTMVYIYIHTYIYIYLTIFSWLNPSCLFSHSAFFWEAPFRSRSTCRRRPCWSPEQWGFPGLQNFNQQQG